MPLVPTLGRQRQADRCEFEASLVYIVSTGKPELNSETLSQENKKELSRTGDVVQLVECSPHFTNP